MTKIIQLRELIKDLSKQQKELRPQRKESFEGDRKFSQNDAISIMRSNKYDLRHYHIAYCLLLGIPYEMVEKKVADNNAPSWSKIEKIKMEYTDETPLRISA